jgi:ABC-type transport system involved in multi-copper enzyme maturation permease subunit
MPNLLWKEWHEQSWKLGFGCIVLAAIAVIGLRARIVADETMVMWVCFIGMTLLPVLSSTGLLPAERAEGCFESLLALPVSPRRILFAKTAIGLLLCIGPMAVAAILSVLAFGGREISSAAMLTLYGCSTLAAMSLFIWMLALTARLPSETRAGLVAMGILIIWLLATAGLAGPLIPSFWGTISPIAFVYGITSDQTNQPPFVGVLAVQCALTTALWLWTTRRMVGAVEG